MIITLLLSRYYGFQCCCSACSLQDKELEDEEVLRESLKEQQAAFRRCHHEDTAYHSEEVAIYIAGLYHLQANLCYILSITETCCDAATDQSQKLEYCLQGTALALSIFGPDSTEAEEWRQRSDSLRLWSQTRELRHH